MSDDLEPEEGGVSGHTPWREIKHKRGSGRPKDGYYTADGTRVPSVTTITGNAKNSDGLVYVAKRNWHQAGKQGLPFDRDAYWGKPETWGTDAAETGSIVHDWIEADLHGTPVTKFTAPTEIQLVQAKQGYQAYLDWRRTVTLEIIETETPIVSEDYGFGGTLDCLALLNGNRVILDWKCSNASYEDYIGQIAAYRQLVNERDWAKPQVQSAFLLRVGKEYGDFHFHGWNQAVLDDGWRWFQSALDLYTVGKRLKKAAS